MDKFIFSKRVQKLKIKGEIPSTESTVFGKAKFWKIWGSDKIFGLSYLTLPKLRGVPFP